MKTVPIALAMFALAGCGGDHKNMSDLPLDWTVGDVVPRDQIYSEPEVSSDTSRIEFFGMRGYDKGHRIYSIPADTPVGDVVRYFQVSSHNALHDEDIPRTIDLVAEKAEQIAALVPCRVIFADAAGLKLKFDRQISEDELAQIEAFFPEDQMMDAGLERYISEFDPDKPLLASVLKENLFHFWWD